MDSAFWVIGLLCVEVGPQMIHSVIHHRGGPLFFALSLIPLFLLLWWLRRGETPKAYPEISLINTDPKKEAQSALLAHAGEGPDRRTKRQSLAREA